MTEVISLGKFVEQTDIEDNLIFEAYQHVDNGGYTVVYDTGGNIGIQFGFHGYSVTRILMAGIEVKDLIAVLQTIEKRKEEYEITEKLKGTW